MTQVLVSVMVSRQFLSSYLHVDTQNTLGKKYVHIQKLDVYWVLHMVTHTRNSLSASFVCDCVFS